MLSSPCALFLVFPAYPFFATIGLIYAAWAVLVERKNLRVPKINLYLPLAIFLTWGFISLIYAPDPMFGMRNILSVLMKPLVTIIIIACATTRAKVEQAIELISKFGTFFSFQAILLILAILIVHLKPIAHISHGADASITQDYNLDFFGPLGFSMVANQIGNIYLPRGQSMFTEPGHMANFMELSIFATLARSAMIDEPYKRANLYFLIAQFVALLFTFSTAGYIALAVGLVVYSFVRTKGSVGHLLLTYIKIGIPIVVALLVVSLAFPTIWDSVVNAIWVSKITSHGIAWQSSSELRERDIQTGIALFCAHPLFGIGWNQLRVVTNWGANNALVTTAAELGIVGLVSYAYFLAAVVSTCAKNIKLLRYADNADTTLAAAAAGAFAAVFTHALFVDSEYLFFFWIAIALNYVCHNLLAQPRRDQTISPLRTISTAISQK